jgi:SAM-dependent methyltransferase
MREDAIIKLAKVACEGINQPIILDIGCGRGELMSQLKDQLNAQVYGTDIDQVCIELSSQYGKTFYYDMDKKSDALIKEYKNTFDLVICSHVLEHLKCPYDAMKSICTISKKYIIIAVPNPHFMLNNLNILLLRRFKKANLGHYYSWDGLHLVQFLEGQLGLKIEKWTSDCVTFIPWKKMRFFFARMGLLTILDGKILPKLFPFASESLIALCCKQ